MAYGFEVGPRQKVRINAGSYDPRSRSPHYEIEILIPRHLHDQVETMQFLMAGGTLWVWDVTNRSTWPAFVTVKRDDIEIEVSPIGLPL